MPTMSTDSVSCHQFIAQSLKSFGVKTVFGLVGIPITEVAFAIRGVGIQFIAHRSEASATYAATGYAYLTTAQTSLPGIALTTGGPGFVNGLAGVSNATVNRWPFVLIAGSADCKDVGKGAFQELDQVNLVRENKEICKAVFRINSIEDVRDVLYRAMKAAVSGVPGGVVVDIPTNVLKASIAAAMAKDKLQIKYPVMKEELHLAEEKVTSALQLLANAKSPLIVIGKGAAIACCENELLEFVDHSGIPFLPTPMGRGMISDDHVLCVAAERSRAMREADVVLCLGCRLNWILHFGESPRWKPDAKFIMVDVAAEASPDKTKIYLTSDLKSALKLFLTHESLLKDLKSRDWISSITSSAAVRKQHTPAPAPPKMQGTLTYAQAFATIKWELEVLKVSKPETRITIVSEGSKTMDISRVALPVFQPRGRLDAGTWGTMGVGLAYAIAARISDPSPSHYVIGIEGDAAIGFSLAELETMTRYKLPVVICVFNNGGIVTGMTAEAPQAPYPTQLSMDTKYSSIMEAVGGVGHRVTTPAALKTALESALKAASPTLIEILIDPLDQEGAAMGPRM